MVKPWSGQQGEWSVQWRLVNAVESGHVVDGWLSHGLDSRGSGQDSGDWLMQRRVVMVLTDGWLSHGLDSRRSGQCSEDWSMQRRVVMLLTGG